MTKHGSIAVVLPSYNPGPDIEMTLDSLRRQTVPFKLFLVDDGSPRKPDYHALLKGFDYKLIELPRNVGVNEVRNPGIEAILAEGFEFIGNMDVGDEMMPERLELQRAFLETHPEVALVGSWMELHIAQSNHVSTVRTPVTHDDIARTLWSNQAVGHPTMMYRADTFRKVGFYSGQYEAAEDYDMMRRTLKAGLRVHNLPQVLLRKYENSESISWKKRRTLLRSRHRIQWAYRDLRQPACLKGMMRTAVLRIMPNSALLMAKKLLKRT